MNYNRYRLELSCLLRCITSKMLLVLSYQCVECIFDLVEYAKTRHKTFWIFLKDHALAGHNFFHKGTLRIFFWNSPMTKSSSHHLNYVASRSKAGLNINKFPYVL